MLKRFTSSLENSRSVYNWYGDSKGHGEAVLVREACGHALRHSSSMSQELISFL